jgi:hypothetical protein
MIRQRDGFVGRSETHGHEHGSEDFVLCERGCRRDIRHQRGRVKRALLRHLQRFGLMNHAALFNAARNERLNAFELHGIDNRAHVDALIQRRPDAQRIHATLQFIDKPLLHTFLHEQSRTGAAHLSLVEPDCIDNAFDRAIEIGVIEDNERRLAAEFQRQGFARTCGRHANLLADFR